MKIVATIEARMASTRLPGKVLLEADGIPMLAHLIHRLRNTPALHDIVVATSTSPADDQLETFAKEFGAKVYRGSESDVMDRVIKAAESVAADVVVQITGDCPLIDPELVDQAIRIFLNNEVRYVSNGAIRTYPDGMDIQVFRLSDLKKSAAMTNDPLDREHVSRHMIQNPQIFSRFNIMAPAKLHWPELGLTLDERGDYELLKKIIEHFGKGNRLFSCGDILHVLRNIHPEWLQLNAEVKRKGLDQ